MKLLKNLIMIAMLLVFALFIGITGFEKGYLLSAISILAIVFFVKKFKIKRFWIFLLVFCLITKIACALVLNVPLTPDYQSMYDASQDLLNGNYEFFRNTYFTAYGYQLGHVFYQTLMLLICRSTVFLKILNCVFASIITLLIYLIVKKITSENIARATSLIYAIALYPIYINSVLGNQQLSLMLFLLGIYILLTKKSSILNRNNNWIIICPWKHRKTRAV